MQIFNHRLSTEPASSTKLISNYLVILVVLLSASCRTMDKSTAGNDQGLFPIYGITLGKTKIEEIKKMGYKCKEGNCSVETLDFWDHDQDGVVESIYTVRSEKIPDKWIKNYGFSWRLSYTEWVRLFKRLGYTIEITEEPKTKEDEDRLTLSAKLHATSITEKIMFVLSFDYGNDDEDGYGVDSPFSLYSITVDKLE